MIIFDTWFCVEKKLKHPNTKFIPIFNGRNNDLQKLYIANKWTVTNTGLFWRGLKYFEFFRHTGTLACPYLAKLVWGTCKKHWNVPPKKFQITLVRSSSELIGFGPWRFKKTFQGSLAKKDDRRRIFFCFKFEFLKTLKIRIKVESMLFGANKTNVKKKHFMKKNHRIWKSIRIADCCASCTEC